MKTAEDEVKAKVKKFQNLESKLLVLQSNLSKNIEFRQFLKLQKEVNNRADEVRAEAQQIMLDNGIEKIDADYVLLTIVKKKNLVIDEEAIDEDLTKVVPDTKKINKFIKEEKRLPVGVEQVDAPYLRMTFRQFVS
jgi:hypothetical protein